MTVHEGLRQDIRFAWRMLRVPPGSSASAILTLGLADGANTALLQMLDAMTVRTLPVHAPENLADVRVDDITHARGAWLREHALTNPLWERIRSEPELFDGSFAWADDTLEMASTGHPAR
jgi:putative ABC transport system permease protein